MAEYNKSTSQYNNTKSVATKFLRRVLSAVLRALPRNAPAFIYTNILKPRPLRTLANALLRAMIPHTISIPEGELILNPNDPVVSGALMLGAYEVSFATVLRKALSPRMTVVDIGANIGYYTLIASATVGSEGRVIVYEPEPENLDILKTMIATNRLENVTVVPTAVGESVGQATLYVDPHNKGKHTLLPVSGNTPTTVATITLDASLQHLDVGRVDLIKMDIEGWEIKAFHGMQNTLKRDHPKIFFEFAPVRIRETGENPLAALEELITLGYTLEAIDEKTGALHVINDPSLFIGTLHGYDGYANIAAS